MALRTEAQTHFLAGMSARERPIPPSASHIVSRSRALCRRESGVEGSGLYRKHDAKFRDFVPALNNTGEAGVKR